MSAHEALIAELREVDNLAAAARLLNWDQETGMPEGGESARAEVVSTLAKLVHERSVAPKLSDLAAAAREEASTPDRKRQVELVERDLERARKVPGELVERLARATSLSQQVWARARKERDFAAFLPRLEEVVELKKEEGRLLAPEGGSVYDGLLSDYERGMRESDWSTLFDELERELPALAREIHERQAPVRERLAGISALRGPFGREAQLKLCRALAEALGYDFSRGRLDLSAHPFSETIHAGDSRITTRVDESDLRGSVYSTLHETGHALYEQGLPEELSGTPLGAYCSMSVHESQSRLWENLVGRSDEFWDARWDRVRDAFPDLAAAGPRAWAEHSRRVEPSLIRTESDEVTYNLHVLVRFRLERALFAGDISPADLPGAWDEAYRKALGIAPSHVGEGVMQDVHWSAGLFGYFPTYTLGNLLSAQLLDAATAAGVDDRGPQLLSWLRAKVHRRGRFLETPDLVVEATGAPPSARAFLAHLRRRYLG
jgi:carboxypeptidase Taq